MTIEADHQVFWQSFYEAGELPWDLQAPSPHFAVAMHDAQITDSFPKPPAELFVPGAGRCHDAVYFASLGYRLMCLDLVPSALLRAEEAYPDYIPEKINYTLGNLFDLTEQPTWQARFDGVIEHTCFCAIPPSLRNAYVEVVSSLLKPAGVLLGVFWEHAMPGGPPFSTSEEELKNLFEPTFDLVCKRPMGKTAGNRSGQETVYLWRKTVL